MKSIKSSLIKAITLMKMFCITYVNKFSILIYLDYTNLNVKQYSYLRYDHSLRVSILNESATEKFS